jgi:hypothetical protein
MKHSDQAIRGMIERVIELSRSYTIWWALVNKENYDRYKNVIDSHEDYFATIIQSLFQGFSVITYQLFERRKNTTSLPILLEELSATDSALARSLQDEIKQMEPLLGKAFSIRCKIYAHRNKSLAPEAVFNDAKLSPNDMEAIVSLSKKIILSIGEVAGVDTKTELLAEFGCREEFARDDTQLILKVLEKHAL